MGELGREARSAGTAIGTSLTQGVTKAQGVLSRLGGAVRNARQSIAQNFKQGIGQLGFRSRTLPSSTSRG